MLDHLCFLQSLHFTPTRSTDVCSPSPIAINPPLPTTGVSPLSTIRVESLAPCNQRFSLLCLRLCVGFKNKWWAFISSEDGHLLTNMGRKNLISDRSFWSLPLHSFLFFSPLSLLILQVITLSLERAILSHWLVFPVFYDQSRGSGHCQGSQGRATKFPDSMFGDTAY